MIVWNFVAAQNNFLGQVLTFTLLYGSLYSTYIWPGESSEYVFKKITKHHLSLKIRFKTFKYYLVHTTALKTASLFTALQY